MTDNGVQPIRTQKVSLPTRAQHYLLELIEDGTYQPGERLPSEADLAVQLGISRPTLREALLNLEQEGVIVRRHGVGTFVRPPYARRLEGGLERLESILELAARQGLQLHFRALEVEHEPASPELASILHLPAGQPLTRVQRVILVDGTPVAYMLDVVPSALLAPEEIDEDFGGSVLDLLRQRENLQAAQAVADIVALDADRSLAEKLAVRRGQALLLIEEILFDDGGTPIEFSRNYFVPDFFRFHVVRR
jgi:GntR family transcriptional regulator